MRWENDQHRSLYNLQVLSLSLNALSSALLLAWLLHDSFPILLTVVALLYVRNGLLVTKSYVKLSELSFYLKHLNSSR